MLELFYKTRFKKDFKKYRRDSDLVSDITYVIDLLVTGERLPPKYREHKLSGGFKGCLECHIRPDLLMIYEIKFNSLILIRIGSHSELF